MLRRAFLSSDTDAVCISVPTLSESECRQIFLGGIHFRTLHEQIDGSAASSEEREPKKCSLDMCVCPDEGVSGKSCRHGQYPLLGCLFEVRDQIVELRLVLYTGERHHALHCALKTC